MSQPSRASMQLSFPAASHLLPAEAYAYGERSSGGTHRLVPTKPHIVDLMLDLAEYVPRRDLGSISFLEPACGHGVFLVRAVDRLCRSAVEFGRRLADLGEAIRGYDIDPAHVAHSRRAVAETLHQYG